MSENQNLKDQTDKIFYSEELNNVLSDVGRKIFKRKNQSKVLDSLSVKKPNLFAYLDLIYLLLDEESKLAGVFWDAFVRAQAFYTQLNSVFDIKQLSELLKIVEENKEKENSKQSKELLESLKEFIAINGLVQKCSEEHIEFKESLSKGAIAEIKIEDKFKNKVINKHKQLLVESILILHGVTPSIHTNYSFDRAEVPKMEIRDLLSRFNLVRNFDQLVQVDRENIDTYMRRRGPSYEKLMEYYEWKETEEFNDGTIREMNEGDRWAHDSELKKGTLRNFVGQAKLVTNQLNLFSNLLDDFNKESVKSRPKFNDFLEESGNNEGFAVPSNFDIKVKKALSKLSEILIARTLLEEKEEYYESVVLYPGNQDQFPPEIKEDSEDEHGRFIYLDPKPAFLNIPILSLSLIAMLKESKSIRNEMNKEGGILQHGEEKDSVTIYSARDWLNETKDDGKSKRKFRFYELVRRDKLTPQKITLNSLRVLHKVNVA